MSKEQVINNIRINYSYFTDGQLDILYDEALYDYLTLTFPYNKSIIDVPTANLRDFLWVQKRMVDIIERLGVSSVVSYKENNMSYDFGNVGISKALLDAIIPNVGTIYNME